LVLKYLIYLKPHWFVCSANIYWAATNMLGTVLV
jgi:hypothetical protein